MNKDKFFQRLEMKNNKILQILKKYITKQKHSIDREILKTEILLLFKYEKDYLSKKRKS